MKKNNAKSKKNNAKLKEKQCKTRRKTMENMKKHEINMKFIFVAISNCPLRSLSETIFLFQNLPWIMKTIFSLFLTNILNNFVSHYNLNSNLFISPPLLPPSPPPHFLPLLVLVGDALQILRLT